MRLTTTRRVVLAAMFGLGIATALPALAQDKPVLRFSDVTQAEAPRSKAVSDIFAKAIGEDFTFEAYFGGTLMKQGTELVALQRGNLDMALLPPSDLANQYPAFSMLSAAYLVRDSAHMSAIFASDVGEDFRKMAREHLNVVILSPAYYGTRHVNLRGDKKINVPADLAGVKLRMPGGEAWQFLGASIGANPVPMDYAEVYTGLQTGAIDGQDNPLPNTQMMKFYEVTDQVVLTGHNVGFGLFLMRADLYDSLSTELQQKITRAAAEAFTWSDAEYVKQEAELVAFLKAEGLDVYTPDVAAFRAYSNQKYLESPLSKDWPEGMLERINAL